MANYAIPENVGDYISENLAGLQARVDHWRSYYTGDITLQNAVYWLLQFGGLERVKLAYTLLEGMYYIDQARLIALLRSAIEQVPQAARASALYCPVGKPYDSAGHITYPLTKALGLREEELNLAWTTVEGLGKACRTQRPSAVLFVDDNITSGTQFRRFLRELTPGYTGAREHVTHPLDDADITTLRGIPIYLAVAVDLGFQQESARATSEGGVQAFEVASGLRYTENAFHFGGRFWVREDDAARAADMAGEIAASLFADKGWAEEKLHDRLLGYGNLGRMVAFQHNVPKSLPGIFWKFGHYAGRPWVPLFAERAEWAAHRAEIGAREPYTEYFAGLVSGGKFRAASPVCGLSMIDETGCATDEILLAEKALVLGVANELSSFLKPLPYVEPPENARGSISDHDHQVDHYNEALPAYRKEFARIVAQLGSVFRLRFRIRNTGTAPATEVTLRLSFPPGFGFLEQLPRIPSPPPQPERPGEMKPMVSPGPYDFASVLDQLRLRTAPESNVQLVFADGNTERFLVVAVGKVVQHTFRDAVVEFLHLPFDSQSSYSIGYQLIYEQASRPIEGTLNVRVVRRPQLILHPDARELLGSYLAEHDEGTGSA